MKRWMSVWFLAGVIGLLWTQQAMATSVIRLNEEQLVDLSTFIVRGKVVSQRAIAGPQGMGIVTLVTIQVQEEMVGRTSPKQVVVRHFGGTLNGRTVSMIGGPSFATGNEVVVFVQKSPYLPQGEYLLVGLTQGKWIVHRPQVNATFSVAGLEPVVVRNLHHVNLVPTPGQQTTPMKNTLTLKDMRLRLQSHYKTIVARRKARILQLPKRTLPKANVPALRPQLIKPKVVQPTTPKKP